jgi:hypothetical protein
MPYQMLLTSLIWKHMYSYISENNFGPSNQIIVPTSYNLKPEKGCVIEKLSSSSSKETGSIVISKDDMEDCLGTINMCLFWISLTMLIVIVVHLAYGGHILQKAWVTSPKYCSFA